MKMAHAFLRSRAARDMRPPTLKPLFCAVKRRQEVI